MPGSRYGMFLTYGTGAAQGLAINAEMLVTVDMGGINVCRPIPFLVDTGAEATTIPMDLMPEVEDVLRYSNRARVIRDVSGNLHFTGVVQATVVLTSPDPKVRNVVFRPEVGFAKDIDFEFGVLGLDALRNIIIVLDYEHMSLWTAT
jgi:hypothetical protein